MVAASEDYSGLVLKPNSDKIKRCNDTSLLHAALSDLRICSAFLFAAFIYIFYSQKTFLTNKR